MNKFVFNDFLQVLNPEEKPFTLSINDIYLSYGCKQEIKESASGYTVSYILNNKTVSNFVCRKSGVKIRFAPQKPFVCDDIINDLPPNMKHDMLRANVCKRLSDPTLCNSKCLMGYAFDLDGESYKKCRAMAFLFSLTDEYMPYIDKFIKKILIDRL